MSDDFTDGDDTPESDEATELTSTSWLQRLGQSFVSVLFGFVLFLAAFPLLFWNEGRAVQTAKSLTEGAANVISVNADKVESANDGKMIHVSGEATTQEELPDPEFGVKVNALRLRRTVEIYQWKEDKKSETKKKTGGGQEAVTTYSYAKSWVNNPIDSSKFNAPEGHQNQGALSYAGREDKASKVTLGAFRLSPGLAARITGETRLPATSELLAKLPSEQAKNLKVTNDGLVYRGTDAANPEIGDLRIEFMVLKTTTVSVVAKQVLDTFEPYQAKAGDQIELLSMGIKGADAMFQASQQKNTMFTWILRMVGFLVMAFGLSMVFSPLVVLADVVPFLGNVLGAGVTVFAGLLSFALSLLTIGAAWVVYRPLLGIAMMAVGIGSIVCLKMLNRTKQPAKSMG